MKGTLITDLAFREIAAAHSGDWRSQGRFQQPVPVGGSGASPGDGQYFRTVARRHGRRVTHNLPPVLAQKSELAKPDAE